MLGSVARSRRSRARDLFARLAQLRQLRGRIVSRLALPDRHQCLPQCARQPQARAAFAARPAGTRRAWRYRRAPPATDVAWLEPYPDSSLEGSPTTRRIRRRAMRLTKLCSSLLSPPSSSCRRASAPRSCCAMYSVGRREAATLLGGSTASINSALQRARETLPNAIPMAGRRRRPRPNPRSKSFSAAICRPGKGMIWTALWPSSKRTRPSPCRLGCNGMPGAKRSGPSLRMAWQTCGGLRLVPTAANGQPAFAVYAALAPTGRLPRTPSTCWRSSAT